MKTPKTLLSLTFIAAVTASGATTGSLDAQEVGSSAAARVSRGDANSDGILDLADLRVMTNVLLWGMPLPVSIRDLDVNHDRRFDSRDITALSDLLAKETGEFVRVLPTIERVIVGDASDDGWVNIADIISLTHYITMGVRYRAPDEAVDINRDGSVDIKDLLLLLAAYAQR